MLYRNQQHLFQLMVSVVSAHMKQSSWSHDEPGSKGWEMTAFCWPPPFYRPPAYTGEPHIPGGYSFLRKQIYRHIQSCASLIFHVILKLLRSAMAPPLPQIYYSQGSSEGPFFRTQFQNPKHSLLVDLHTEQYHQTLIYVTNFSH